MSTRIRLMLVAVLAILFVVSGRKLLRSSVSVVEITGSTMGTTYSIKISDTTLSEGSRGELDAAVSRRLATINGLMSTYDSTSELERFNRSAPGSPVPASWEVIEVFRIARETSQRSRGAFDVTIRPLVDAWGFGPSERSDVPPSDSLVQALRTTVGFDKIVIDTIARTLIRTGAGVIADLSAIAKGYGVDVIADFLAASGFCCYLVEIGGEVRAAGLKEGGVPWRIGLETPRTDRIAIQGSVELRDAAMATSGDYRNLYEWNGNRYAHIIDPRTGYPVPYRSTAVTVIHSSTAVADAWATALTVLGPEEGFALAEAEDVAAHFAWFGPEGLETKTTQRFRAHYPISPSGGLE